MILNEHEEIEKCDEEIELQPEAQVPFPMIDINEVNEIQLYSFIETL